MKLLFVDDQPETVEPAKRALEATGEECSVSLFGETEKNMDEFGPDIVILDLFEGPPAEQKATGLEDYDVVWNERFCPIVVYSAFPEAAAERHPPHPFVKLVKKGQDLTQLQTAVGELQPHVETLREAEKHVRKQFALALRDVAPDAFRTFDTAADRYQAVVRSGRRRLAALMDAELEPGQKLASWEHYIYPPIGQDLQLGDILMRVGTSKEDPDNFRLVLSPSCDLVESHGRSPKVADILAARCCSLKEGLKLIGVQPTTSKTKLREKFSPILTQGYSDAMYPIASLAERIPCMVANLKNLELIAFEQIGTDENQFERIASMDSPFRELVSWSYLQVAGRPGVPDRDVDKWTDEILLACEDKAKAN